MSTALATRSASAAEDRSRRPADVRAHRFTVEQYHRMIETGVLTTEQRVELLDGVVVDKMVHNPPHSSAVRRLIRILGKLLPADWITSPQLPVTLKSSEPEPDLAVVVGREERYDERHPQPREVGLIIEVADDSLPRDRNVKGPIYAAARIPEYWIVNLLDQIIEVYSQPKSGRLPAYKNIVSFLAPQSVPLILSGKTIANIPVKEILP